jgi:hypothetical protein
VISKEKVEPLSLETLAIVSLLNKVNFDESF